jgi:hypothetical protein
MNQIEGKDPKIRQFDKNKSFDIIALVKLFRVLRRKFQRVRY